MRTSINILFTVLLSSYSILAQRSESDLVLDKIMKLDSIMFYTGQDSLNDQVAFINTKTIVLDNEAKKITSNTITYRTYQKLYSKTDLAEMIQMDSITVTVLHEEKTVFINNSIKTVSSINKSYNQKKNLFKHSEISSFTSNDSVANIKLTVETDSLPNVFIQSIEYQYDLLNDRLLNNKVFYNEDYKIYMYKTTYLNYTTDVDYKFKKSVFDYIYTRRNQLKPQYRGYKIIDSRSK